MAEFNTFTKVTDGSQLNEGYFNGIGRFHSLYTGNGFDSSASGGADVQNHELTAVSASQIGSQTYAKITINGTARVRIAGTGTSYVQIQIESEEIGGATAISLAYTQINYFSSDTANGTLESINNATLVHHHILSAGEKTNGVKFKVFSKSVADDATDFDNIETSIELV